MKKVSKNLKIMLALLLLGAPLIPQMTTYAEAPEIEINDEYFDDLDEEQLEIPEIEAELEEESVELEPEIENDASESEDAYEEEDFERITTTDAIPFSVQPTHRGEGITTRIVQFREGPGTEFESRRGIAQSAIITILNQEQGNWWYVEIEGETGWMYAGAIREIARLGEVSTATAEFRVGPGTVHASMRRLTRGTELEILGSSINGNWRRARIGNQVGWVYGGRVNVMSRLSEISTANAEFRVGPGTAHPSMRRLTRDTELEIIGTITNGNWRLARIGNQLGWVYGGRVRGISRSGAISTATAEFRQGPGTAHASMRRLTRGIELEIIGSSSNGNWHRVRIGNQLGWVYGGRVHRVRHLGTVSTANAEFRVGPGTAHASMRRLTRGTELEMIGATANGNWHRVRIGNEIGWVYHGRIMRGTRFGAVSTANAEFRQGPGTAHTSMRRLTRGTELEIIGTSSNGNWLRARIGNQAGWVYHGRVNYSTRSGLVSTATAEFRQGPGTAHASMRRLSRGNPVEIIGASLNGNWLRVRNGNQIGWVYGGRVERTSPMFDEIEDTLRRLVGGRSGIGISYICLNTGRQISINGNRNFFGASTIKLPTNMLVAEAVHEGRLTWDQRLTILQSDWIGGSGVLQNRARVGQQFTIYELMRLSVVYSDNIAHRMLARTVIPNFRNDSIGLDNGRMELTTAIFNRYLPHHRRPNSRMIFTPIQASEIVNILHRDQHVIEGYGIILNYMQNTSWNNRFVTNLTRNHVAHTPAWTHPFQHDSGIFFTNNPYILVVYTEGVGGIPFLSQVADEVFRIHRRFER